MGGKDDVSMRGLLIRAMEISRRVHAGAVDRYGVPYILHPVRVMERMRTDGEKIVAILHDVVEDGGMTCAELAGEGFPESIVADVERLTRREGESYDVSIGRAMTSDRAARVKIADLEDNMDLRRFPEIGEKEVKRLMRYHRSRLRLLEKLDAPGGGGI